MLETIKSTAAFIKNRSSFLPEIGIVLGTGLGSLVNEIEIVDSIDYSDIPNFPTATVKGHEGKLILGCLNGTKVIAMQGRFHYYEGYSMASVVFPVRVMKLLGITKLFISNASGGVNPDFKVGDIMIVKDHINFFGTNPLIGANIDELGPRFPDMSEAYDKTLIQKAKAIAKEKEIKVVEGVYVGLTGPSLETPSEYKLIRIMGGDAVGMSSVPEIIAARHMGLTCFAISIICDLGVPGKIVKITHEDVQAVAEAAEPKMTQIIKELVTS